jgi:1-deoxy-D-xylulose-5-phosphate synthase
MSLRELQALAGEIRAFLVSSVRETGGHLASNLGVVELTIALHYCFDSPGDKIVWDVGHQCYVHKLLTGRGAGFKTLRARGGMSGFPKASESPHDAFNTGHASTSVSAALGLAAARDLAGEGGAVIAVIGDGAMSGGLAFEALNCAGRAGTNLIVILNDNQMSISKSAGALTNYLNDLRTRRTYLSAKRGLSRLLEKTPLVGGLLAGAASGFKNFMKQMLVPPTVFDDYGFNYIGPADGHDLRRLISVLERVKGMKGPILLHVHTKKGKGCPEAELDPERFHSVNQKSNDTEEISEVREWNTYSDVFGWQITRLAEKNGRIAAITAAMPASVGLSGFRERFPDRFFDVGIAEGHAVTFAAGLAKGGFIPVVAVYSTFLQRGYDQILHDAAISNLHVVFAVDRAGISGGDGETHQGLYDLAYLSHIPNMVVMTPKNRWEFADMLEFALEHPAPTAIRYPRGAAGGIFKEARAPVELGRAEVIESGRDIILIFAGDMAETAAAVSERLKKDGRSPALVNIRFIKPVDGELVRSLAEYRYVFTLETAAGSGGLGSIIAREGLCGGFLKNAEFYSFALPDEFVPQGTRSEAMKEYGLDADGVYRRIREIMEKTL